MRRRAFFAAMACAFASPLAAPAARAQDATDAMDEVDRFRAVLSAMAANAALRRAGDTTPVRIRRTRDGLQLEPDGATWTAAAPADDMVARLLAAFCGSGPIREAVAALGYELGDDELGYAPTPGYDGDANVRRVGGPLASLSFEAGIFRPRSLTIGRDETRWSVVALTYGTVANGWFPERLDVLRGDEVVASLALTDAGPSLSDLAPMQLPGTATRAPTQHYPRIPL